MKRRLLLSFTLFSIICGTIIISCDNSQPEGYFVNPANVEADYETEEEREDSVEIAKIYNKDSQYIVVFGDIQEYTTNSKRILYFANSLKWIKEKQDSFQNIQCVLHVGDVTWYNTTTQWEFFQLYAQPFSESIPFITVTGNHDYTFNDGFIDNRSSTLISQYADFPSLESNIIARYDNGIENIIVKNTINNERYDIIALEFGARPEVVEWADKYIKSNPHTKFIFLTHEWLSHIGKRVSNHSDAEKQLRNTTFSSPEQIWNKLIYPNDNIVCTLCGHNGQSFVLYSPNVKGRNVPQILFNLQFFENGGNGLIELWEFPPNSNYAKVRIVSTITNSLYYKENLLNYFRFKYKY